MNDEALPVTTPRRWRPPVTPLLELGVLAVAIAVAIGTALLIAGAPSSRRLLTPPLVALALIANLLPSVCLIILLGRRVALRRAAKSGRAGENRLHVRLVALFSILATIPTLLAIILAAVMFQYGVEFWLSDRVSGVLKNAAAVAQESFNQTLSRWNGEVLTMSSDVANWNGGQITGSNAKRALKSRDEAGFSLPEFLALQTFQRNLSESALFTVTDGKRVNFIVRVDEYGDLERQIDPLAVAQVAAGSRSVVTVQGNRIRVLSMVPGTKGLFLYAAKVEEGALPDRPLRQTEQIARDFAALQSRARALQLQFNATLFIVALLIVAAAMWVALRIADRLVRPVNDLVGAARRVADGDLSARVPVVTTRDEVGTLATAFNRMTERLGEQTAALDARRALIEAVLSGVTAGVISVGQRREVRLLNRSAAQLLNIGPESPAGRPLKEVAPELDLLLDGDEREAIVQVEAGGEARTLAVKLTRDRDGLVLTFDDITQQLLDQRRAAWSDVARRIAHEIKNPLTPIQLAAERLQRRYGSKIDPADPTFAKLTDTIVRQVGDLRRIVDEFSSFARMPKPRFRAEPLIDIAGQTLFLHEVAHPAIRFVLDAPKPVVLVCDRRQIGQALTNLVKNAVEAIEARGEQRVDGEVVLSLREDDRAVTIAVADNGIGLPPERDRIAEPYVTTRARGTGLGLAIVSKIVEDHCGTLAFADRPAVGTVMTLSFDTQALAGMPVEPDREGDPALALLHAGTDA